MLHWICCDLLVRKLHKNVSLIFGCRFALFDFDDFPLNINPSLPIFLTMPSTTAEHDTIAELMRREVYFEKQMERLREKKDWLVSVLERIDSPVKNGALEIQREKRPRSLETRPVTRQNGSKRIPPKASSSDLGNSKKRILLLESQAKILQQDLNQKIKEIIATEPTDEMGKADPYSFINVYWKKLNYLQESAKKQKRDSEVRQLPTAKIPSTASDGTVPDRSSHKLETPQNVPSFPDGLNIESAKDYGSDFDVLSTNRTVPDRILSGGDRANYKEEGKAVHHEKDEPYHVSLFEPVSAPKASEIFPVDSSPETRKDKAVVPHVVNHMDLQIEVDDSPKFNVLPVSLVTPKASKSSFRQTSPNWNSPVAVSTVPSLIPTEASSVPALFPPPIVSLRPVDIVMASSPSSASAGDGVHLPKPNLISAFSTSVVAQASLVIQVVPSMSLDAGDTVQPLADLLQSPPMLSGIERIGDAPSQLDSAIPVSTRVVKPESSPAEPSISPSTGSTVGSVPMRPESPSGALSVPDAVEHSDKGPVESVHSEKEPSPSVVPVEPDLNDDVHDDESDAGLSSVKTDIPEESPEEKSADRLPFGDVNTKAPVLRESVGTGPLSDSTDSQANDSTGEQEKDAESRSTDESAKESVESSIAEDLEEGEVSPKIAAAIVLDGAKDESPHSVSEGEVIVAVKSAVVELEASIHEDAHQSVAEQLESFRGESEIRSVPTVEEAERSPTTDVPESLVSEGPKEQPKLEPLDVEKDAIHTPEEMPSIGGSDKDSSSSGSSSPAELSMHYSDSTSANEDESGKDDISLGETRMSEKGDPNEKLLDERIVSAEKDGQRQSPESLKEDLSVAELDLSASGKENVDLNETPPISARSESSEKFLAPSPRQLKQEQERSKREPKDLLPLQHEIHRPVDAVLPVEDWTDEPEPFAIVSGTSFPSTPSSQEKSVRVDSRATLLSTLRPVLTSVAEHVHRTVSSGYFGSFLELEEPELEKSRDSDLHSMLFDFVIEFCEYRYGKSKKPLLRGFNRPVNVPVFSSFLLELMSVFERDAARMSTLNSLGSLPNSTAVEEWEQGTVNEIAFRDFAKTEYKWCDFREAVEKLKEVGLPSEEEGTINPEQTDVKLMWQNSPDLLIDLRSSL